MRTKSVAALVAVSFLIAGPAAAAVSLNYSGSSDAAYEGAGGYLNASLGLPLVNGSTLIPVERAVGEVRIGSRSDQRRVGFHVPTAGTGLPAPAGSGVTTALTSVAPVGSSTTPWINGASRLFSIKRVGTTLTYMVGNQSWSATESYFGDINAFEIRIRSNGTGAASVNSLALTGLVYQDAVTAGQALADIDAADGALAIRLFSGVTGDFSLSGAYGFSWSGTAPTNSALASQIKLLALPGGGGVPEPASWAMMIGGFGLVGGAMRRRAATVTRPA